MREVVSRGRERSFREREREVVSRGRERSFRERERERSLLCVFFGKGVSWREERPFERRRPIAEKGETGRSSAIDIHSRS